MGADVAERCPIEQAGAPASVSPAEQRCGAAQREAQAAWAAVRVSERLAVLRRARQLMAQRASEFSGAISSELSRTPADTLVAELLPLLDACRFLECSAARILRTRRLGRRGVPWWLNDISSAVERVPFGQILIFGPANYPLFLPGVQAMQALAAGNAVVWKPGRAGRAVAEVFAQALYDAGLPPVLLVVSDETIGAGQQALAGAINGVAPGKVIFTGSVQAGRQVLHSLAESLTPCVAELSGCDAVVALPSAPLERLIEALRFGMRFNGSATCMAPRRLFLLGFSREHRERLLAQLRDAFASMQPTPLPFPVAVTLRGLLQAARRQGASVTGEPDFAIHSEFTPTAPILITEARPEMEITRTDIFAPVLSVLDVTNREALLAAEEQCAYALTIAIFGHEGDARDLARSLTAGTVLINDLIVPTADPRVPFGGRRLSGFGVTRGAEGLLEMTAPRTVSVRRSKDTRHYEPTGPYHLGFFKGLVQISHGTNWRERWQGLRQLLAAARNLR